MYVAETGDFNKLLSGVGCSDSIKELARNLPAFYQLMPTERNADFPYIQAGDTNYRGSQARTYYSNLSWAKNGSTNKPMYNTATSFHSSLIVNDTHVANSSSVVCYKIFGLGEDTPCKIVYDANGNYLRTEKNTSGDGTVLQDSATNTLMPTLANKTYQINASHTGLLNNLSCLVKVTQIIRGTATSSIRQDPIQFNDRGWINGEDNRRI